MELAFLLHACLVRNGDLASPALTTCVPVKVTGFLPPIPRSKQQGSDVTANELILTWNIHTFPAAVGAAPLCEKV